MANGISQGSLVLEVQSGLKQGKPIGVVKRELLKMHGAKKVSKAISLAIEQEMARKNPPSAKKLRASGKPSLFIAFVLVAIALVSLAIFYFA